MSGECQVNVKSLSELDIGGRETCLSFDLRICLFELSNPIQCDRQTDTQTQPFIV